jgi:hypothetical protein
VGVLIKLKPTRFNANKQAATKRITTPNRQK